LDGLSTFGQCKELPDNSAAERVEIL
jgi:hypothetical protein